MAERSDTIEAIETRWDTYRARHEHLQRAADTVREALRDAILESELPPGSRLREEELARQFKVSRTPVREALQQLSAEGLIDVSPHQGAIVARLTVEDILQIYLVREALEGVAARLAAKRATRDQCARMLAIVTQMEAGIGTLSPGQLAELNLQFHAEVRRASGNRYLDRFLSQIEQAVRRFGQTTFDQPGRVETACAEHRAIVDAVCAGDSANAESVAVAHMREARQLRLRMLFDEH